MMIGTGKDKDKDDEDDKDEDRDESGGNDHYEGNDGEVYLGYEDPNDQNYDEMNFHDPEDQSYAAVELTEGNEKREGTSPENTLLAGYDDWTNDGKNQELYPVFYSVVDENEEVEDDKDDKDYARKDEMMIVDSEILMMDPVEVKVDRDKKEVHEKRELTETERIEVTSWEKCFDQARRTTSDRTIGSTFVALAKYGNDEPKGLQECRVKEERFMSVKV